MGRGLGCASRGSPAGEPEPPSRGGARLEGPGARGRVGPAGVTRVLSYMVDHLVRAGALRTVLEACEPPPIPVHVVHPAGSHLPLRTRLFLDLAVASLRRRFDVA